jgi:hypothetical protein
MASADPRTARPNLRTYGLRVSPYERVASMVISLLVLVGMSVLTMLILWLTSKIFATQAAVPVALQDIGTGEGGPMGGMELDAPMAEELGMPSDLEEPALETTLQAIDTAVASQQALLDNPALTDDELSGQGGSTGDGRGFGRGSGSGGFGRARHWEVRFFEGNTLESYARQLDFFRIELGVLMPGNQVTYVSELSSANPRQRTGQADQEDRYYLTWLTGELEQADRALLEKAGVAYRPPVLKFLERKLEGQLAAMEQTRAGREADNVRATYFGVLPEGRGYKFYIIDQTYR